MVDALSSNYATMRGLSQLLQGAGGDSSGLFNTLSGTSTNNNTGLYSALSGKTAPASIDSILHDQKVSNSRNGMYVDIAQRLSYMQQGLYQPKADWEKVVGYGMQTGQPVMAFIDGKGQVQADLQGNTDLAKFNSQQLPRVLQAIDDVTVMGQKINANKTNQTWLDNLAGAANNLQDVFTYQALPQTSTANNWEQTGLLLMRQNRPIKISLDEKGDLQVVDQRYSDMSELPFHLQTKLRAAVESISEVISTGDFTETWHVEAAALAENGVPYYLDIDPTTYQITVKENSAENITPDFLKQPPYPNVGDDTQAMKDIAQLIRDGKPFFLDIDPVSQNVIGKEATGQNLIKYNAPANQSPDQTLGVGSILSLFA